LAIHNMGNGWRTNVYPSFAKALAELAMEEAQSA
jgi:hypothetical protein